MRTVVTALAMCAVSATAQAEPERRGFTLELGIGAAATVLAESDVAVRGGLAPCR